LTNQSKALTFYGLLFDECRRSDPIWSVGCVENFINSFARKQTETNDFLWLWDVFILYDK